MDGQYLLSVSSITITHNEIVILLNPLIILVAPTRAYIEASIGGFASIYTAERR